MTASHPTYYDQRKFEIQKKRLISALDKLAAGDLSARKPSLKSLEKYGLYDAKTHKITIPTHMQPPKLNYSAIPEPEAQPVIQVVRNYDSNPVEKFDLSTAEVTGEDIRNWVYTELSGVAMKTTKVRGKETLNLYANVAKNLCKIRNVPYDDKENVFKYFNDPTTTIEKEEETRAGKVASGTRAKFYMGVLFLSQNYPKLKGYISQDVINIYDSEYKKLGNMANAEQNTENANKIYFTWDVIRDEILNDFGYKKKGIASDQALLILLFNEVHGRDDFGAKMAYKVEDVKTGADVDSNYLFLDRESGVCRLYMNKYKTSGSYKPQIFTLDKKLSELIIKLHPDDSSKTLFPESIGKDATKIGAFLKKTMRECPLFDKEDLKKPINYIRHSIVSTALLHIKLNDPNRIQKMTALADKSFHSIKMQQNTYKSRLKDRDGNEIIIPPEISKEYDAITTVILGDDGTVEEGEEGESSTKKPKPKPVKLKLAKLKPKSAGKPRLAALLEKADEEGGGDSDEIAPVKKPAKKPAKPAKVVPVKPPVITRRSARLIKAKK